MIGAVSDEEARGVYELAEKMCRPADGADIKTMLNATATVLAMLLRFIETKGYDSEATLAEIIELVEDTLATAPMCGSVEVLQ